MSNTTCKLCAMSIPEAAKVCPYCGCRISNLNVKNLFMTAAVVLVLCAVIGVVNRIARPNTVQTAAAPVETPVQMDCRQAKEAFNACSRLKGDSYVNCLADLHMPPDCGETSLNQMVERANAK